MSITVETHSGTITSIIPLTDIYTPSAGCESYFRQHGTRLFAYDPGFEYDIDSRVSCGPSAYSQYISQFDWRIHTSTRTVVLNPLQCPYSWTTVATSAADLASTSIMCCPSGYYLKNGVPGELMGDCASDVSSGMKLTWVSRDGSTRTSTMTESSFIGAMAAGGWNVKRNALSTPPAMTSTTETSGDTATSFPISTSTSPSPSFSVITTTASPTIFNTPSASMSSKGSALSPVSIAGMAVGAVLGVVGIIALIVALFLFRRWKRQASGLRQKSTDHSPVDPAMDLYRTEVSRTPVGKLPELPAPILEFPDHGARSPTELSSGRRRW